MDLARGLRARVTLILVQKITTQQWQCCVSNAFPEAECVALTGLVRGRAEIIRRLARKKRDQPLVLILNWDVLYRLANDLAKFGDRLDLIIADEATRLRNRTSQVSKAARKLAKTARWRIPLTGTPMSGDPSDLWALFAFMDDRIFGRSYWDFVKRYCRLGGFTGWEFAGLIPEQLPELIEKLHANSYRATKATALDLPPKLYQTVRLEMEPEQARVYRELEKEYGVSVALEGGGTGSLSVTSAIAQTTRLQQITAGILPLTEVEGGEEVSFKELPSAKTAWTVEYVKTTLEDTDAQIVVWTKFKAEVDRVAQELRAAGVEVEVIDGRVSDRKRAQALERYGNRENQLRVLLIQIQAGAYGLDLQGCDVLIYHSSSFAILDRIQSEDRGHRAGRKRSYQVIDLVLRGTVDEAIEEARRRRLDLMTMLTGQGAPSQERRESGDSVVVA